MQSKKQWFHPPAEAKAWVKVATFLPDRDPALSVVSDPDVDPAAVASSDSVPYDRKRDPVSAFRDRDRGAYLHASIDYVYSVQAAGAVA